jgi:serine/threonine protein kinase
LIYSGAFSKVYQALKLSTKEKVAIKIVNKSELNQQQVKKKSISYN